MQLDFEEIKKLIPQRFPFIMIDRVLEVERGKHAVAVKNVSGNDIFFLGHFPEKAIMPGVAIIEAMAQTAIILFANPPLPPLVKGGEGGFVSEKGRGKPIYLLGSVKARFHLPVVPGDQLKIKVVNVKSLPNTTYVSAEAFVDDKKVSEAELVFSVKDE
jgi:3-hydroxyacyl-[acyl-carrier-protein] dehydratase